MQPYEDASFAADVSRLRFQIRALFFFQAFRTKTASVNSSEIVFFFFFPPALLARPFRERSLERAFLEMIP